MESSQSSPSPSSTLVPSPTQVPVISPTATATPSSTEKQSELVAYALSLINADRQASGLQNVTLSSVDSGQTHAENMLLSDYFSHWDTNGYKPYMRYTLAGGQGAVAENVAWQGQTGNIFPMDVKTALKDMEYSMMYDDASSNWGHRDNILKPEHNKVSIGIAYDNHNVYFIEDFEDDYVTWNQRNVSNDQVTIQGTILQEGVAIQSVGIFYDNPASLTVAQLGGPQYQDGYGPGTYVGLALPPDYQATGAITILADTWNQTGVNFEISFSLTQAIDAYGKGVYTLYVLKGSSTENSLTTYSVWIS